MVVAFDNNVLCLLIHPGADIPTDPGTGKPIHRAQERMAFLVEQLAQMGTRIVLPAPVISEFLTFASGDYLAEIHGTRHFVVSAFDERAAIEAAVALRKSLHSGKGKKLGLTSEWQKIKVDRQIVAIAKVEGASAIYSTDKDVLALAGDSGIHGVHVADLPLPPSNTPLLDDLASGTSETSTALPQPSGQSGDGASQKEQPSVLALPAGHQADPAPQPPDSSPDAAPPPPSKK